MASQALGVVLAVYGQVIPKEDGGILWLGPHILNELSGECLPLPDNFIAEWFAALQCCLEIVGTDIPQTVLERLLRDGDALPADVEAQLCAHPCQ